MTLANSQAEPVLGPLERAVVALASLTACGDVEGLEAEARLACRAGVAAEELRETLLVASLFVGFPRALVATQVLTNLLGAVTTESCDRPDVQLARERGVEVFKAIHGPTAKAQLGMLAKQPAPFVDALLSYAYGHVLARERFDIRLRELVAIGCLAALDLPLVLRAHLMAAKRHGASRAQLRAAVELACELADRPMPTGLELLKQMPG